MHRTQGTARSGFTLVELIIVVAIIGIIAAIALPKLMAARLSANETSAIATLRSLSTAQVQMLSQASIDTDGDGAGEQAYFGEMAGTAGLRQTAGGLAVLGGTHLNPTVLSTAFGTVNAQGLVSHAGYFFQIWLPATPVGGSTPGISERASVGGADPSNLPDSDGGEVLWCAYAWPMAAHETGNRAFFVNEHGDMLQCDNRVPLPYTGTVKMPGFDEAFVGAGDMASSLRLGVPGGSDGTVWHAVN